MNTFSDIESCIPEDSFWKTWLSIWPLAEPPKSFILFSGMAMLGAALGRRVYFDQDIHLIYPMLNTLLIGPSGIGKSTALMAMGYKLILTLPSDSVGSGRAKPYLITGAVTPERLHDELISNPHAIIFASELAAFFTRSDYNSGLIPYVTRLLDYEDTVTRGTKGSGKTLVVDKPATTIVGGSTVEWLQDQLPDSATSGGFLARFLIIKEDHKGQRVPNPQQALSNKQKATLEERRLRAFAEFRELTELHAGRIDYLDYSAADTYAAWYQTYQPATGHLAPFAARAGEFVLRLSILLGISRHQAWITEEDIRAAIKLYEYATAKLQSVVVPFTREGKLLQKVMDAVGAGACTLMELRRAMRNHADSNSVDGAVASLVRSGELKMDGEKVRKVRLHG